MTEETFSKATNLVIDMRDIKAVMRVIEDGGHVLSLNKALLIESIVDLKELEETVAEADEKILNALRDKYEELQQEFDEL